MGKSHKGGLLVRRRAALARLETTYKSFKAAGEDKKPWDSYRRGHIHHHKGRSYADECKRLSDEIKHLKDIINKVPQ